MRTTYTLTPHDMSRIARLQKKQRQTHVQSASKNAPAKNLETQQDETPTSGRRTIAIQITMDKDLVPVADALALKFRRSRSNLIEYLLSEAARIDAEREKAKEAAVA